MNNGKYDRVFLGLVILTLMFIAVIATNDAEKICKTVEYVRSINVEESLRLSAEFFHELMRGSPR